MNNRKYPFHESLKLELYKIDSPLWALRLVRQISYNLDCTQNEAELILTMTPHSFYYTVENLYSLMSHLSTNTIDKMIRKLVFIGALEKHSSDNPELPVTYSLRQELKNCIKQLDKESLRGK